MRGFGVVAIKAIQEQQEQLNAVKADNEELKKEVAELKQMVLALQRNLKE